MTYIAIFIPKFHSHDIWTTPNMSGFIDRTPRSNCISTVSTSELHLGVIAHISEDWCYWLINWIKQVLNKKRLIEEKLWGYREEM